MIIYFFIDQLYSFDFADLTGKYQIRKMKLKLFYILLIFTIGKIAAQEKLEVFFDFDKLFDLDIPVEDLKIN